MWSLNLKQIHEAAPDVVYLTVKNASASTLSTGHAVFFNYTAANNGTASYTANTILHVTLNATTAANQYAAGLFAGPVAKTDIGPYAFGYVQKHGPHPGVLVTGLGAGANPPPFSTSFFAVTNNNVASLGTVQLRPVACFGNTTGAVTNIGYFGAVPMSTTIAGTAGYASADINQCLQAFWPGGYLVPLDNPTGAVSISSNSSGRVKAFCYCL